MHPADQGLTGAVNERVSAAANDEIGPVPPAGGEDAAAAGWDPFEVWRTRIRDARRAPTEPDAD